MNKNWGGALAGTPSIAGPVIQMERMRRTSWGGTPKVMVLRSTFWYDSIHGSTKKIPANQNKMLHLRLISFPCIGPKRFFLPVQIVLDGSKCWRFFPKITFQYWILLFEPWLRHFHSDQENLDWSKIILDLQKDKALTLIGMREGTFIPLSFLDLTLSASWIFIKNFGGENWHQSG